MSRKITHFLGEKVILCNSVFKEKEKFYVEAIVVDEDVENSRYTEQYYAIVLNTSIF